MAESKELTRQRNRLLKSVTDFLEGPMATLGFIWLLLLIIEFTGYSSSALLFLGSVIWIIFILDFLLKFILAPYKLAFLKNNLFTAVSLLVPALRFLRAFRFFRLLRVFKGTRLIKVIASINRGMRSLNATMKRRGFGYVMILTIAIILAGAAGMSEFESQEGVLKSYPESIWWTIMLVITIGSEYWPKTSEGRILCILLSVYGFAVFGYITATLASFFIGRDAEEKRGPVAGAADIEHLKRQIAELTELIKADRRN